MKLLLEFSQMTKRTFPFALAMLCAACAHAQVVATNDLHLGYIGQPYAGQMTATGGTEPYTWSVSGGALPSGISLSSGGALSGTPTASGTFSVTIKVTDHDGATATKPFSMQVFEQPTDKYGGLINKPCSNGPRAHFYTQKMGKRWYFCTPAGNAFFQNALCAVSATDPGTDYQGVVQTALRDAKYATGYTNNSVLNWSLITNRRLLSWGINAIAPFAMAYTLPYTTHAAWPTADHTNPVKLPYTMLARPTYYQMHNTFPAYGTPLKDMMAGISNAVYPGYRWMAADIYDPSWATFMRAYFNGDVATHNAITAPHNDYAIGIMVDQADEMGGLGAGTDFPTTGNGVVALGHYQPHLGWIALVTAPTQASNASLGVASYTDTTAYTKAQIVSWLSTQYGGSIAALNTAWGSHYITFGASGGGFGVGTGLLDENGTCPSKGAGSCWIPTDAMSLTGATAAVKNDLDAFLLVYAQYYFSTIKGVLNSVAPGFMYLTTSSLGSYSSPPRRQILQAAGQYADVLTLATFPADCIACTDKQARIDFVAQYGGDKPWTSWQGFTANADSYESPFASENDEFETQAARGSYYQSSMIPGIFNSCDTPTTTCHQVGFNYWAYYDSRGEKQNWGLVTPRDDPYDGVSATPTPGYDSWGYPTGCVSGYGCEQASYGDFITYVRKGNLWVLDQLAGTPPPTTTINLTTAPH